MPATILGQFSRDSLSATSIRDYLANFYSGLPFERSYIDLYSCFFEALATTTGALLVHCTGGKDRTGLIVLPIESRRASNDILADYLLTNEVWSFDVHEDSGGMWDLGSTAGCAPGEAAVRAVMEVDARYLDTAFSAIEAGAGSSDAYFETVLGIEPSVRDAIMGRLLIDHD